MAIAKKRAASKVLPMVPSELIDIAIKDMRKALAKGWVIDMGSWYDPKAQVTCMVGNDIIIDQYTACLACAAGSVMALSLANASQQKSSLEPNQFRANARQLQAINNLRQGRLTAAYDELGLEQDYSIREFNKSLNTNIPEFNQKKPEVFFKAMKAFSTKLKKAGR